MRIFSSGKQISDKEYFELILRLAEITAFNEDGTPVGYAKATKHSEEIDTLTELFFGGKSAEESFKNIEAEAKKRSTLEGINNVAMKEVTRLIGEKLYDLTDTKEHKVPKFLDEIILKLDEKGCIKWD